MDSKYKIPLPVTFNSFKHHRAFILKTLKESSTKDIEILADSVNPNYVDIYTGKLSPFTVCTEIINWLKQFDFFEKNNFYEWVNTSKGYFTVNMSDGSEWAIRGGEDPVRYIHIHPSRNGPFSFRFKGSTLKTIYMLKKEHPELNKIPTPEMVNKARINIGLSPIKKLEPGKGILKCWGKFFDES